MAYDGRFLRLVPVRQQRGIRAHEQLARCDGDGDVEHVAG